MLSERIRPDSGVFVATVSQLSRNSFAKWRGTRSASAVRLRDMREAYNEEGFAEALRGFAEHYINLHIYIYIHIYMHVYMAMIVLLTIKQ